MHGGVLAVLFLAVACVPWTYDVGVGWCKVATVVGGDCDGGGAIGTRSRVALSVTRFYSVTVAADL